MKIAFTVERVGVINDGTSIHLQSTDVGIAGGHASMDVFLPTQDAGITQGDIIVFVPDVHKVEKPKENSKVPDTKTDDKPATDGMPGHDIIAGAAPAA